MTRVHRTRGSSTSQPDFFVGWWEIVSYIRDGEPVDLSGVIEHIDAAGNFTVFRDGERIGAGHHADFTVDPDGFTNAQEVADAHTPTGRELAVYRFSGDVLEVCKASEHQGRPTRFASPRGSGWTHAVIRRINDADPRVGAQRSDSLGVTGIDNRIVVPTKREFRQSDHAEVSHFAQSGRPSDVAEVPIGGTPGTAHIARPVTRSPGVVAI